MTEKDDGEMLTDANELLTKIVSDIRHAAPDGWKRLIVVAKGMGNSADITTAAYFDKDDSQISFWLDTETNFSILDLRDEMCRKSTGTWYVARFTIDASGELNTEFDYDSSPFGDELDKDMRNVLREDHELYPRDPEHLPDWHPSAN